MDALGLAQQIFDSPTRSFAVELWSGALLPPRCEGPPRGKIRLCRPGAVAALLPPVDEVRIAEAYLGGDFELEGDAVGLVEAVSRWEGPRRRLGLAVEVLRAKLRDLLRGGGAPGRAEVHGRRHSRQRDGEAVRHHYDLSDAFYRLFLDRDLVYSCAYFQSGSESLEEAQRAKLELVCRKLQLAPGERFLDVGCGWGALLAHAARRHGVRGTGITRSENQLAEARRRLGEAPGPPLASVAGDDYRSLRPDRPFDKVASVGMMEHVGREHLADYFGAMWRLTRPGGLFLNHAIADAADGARTVPWASQRGGGFIGRYIFPDSDLVPLGLVVAAAERVGFEVRDVESLREHYAATLSAWLSRLEERSRDAVALVGERRTRAYRLYLATSAAAFRLGRISVFQLLLARKTEAGRAEGIPRCRADWYAPPLSSSPEGRLGEGIGR